MTESDVIGKGLPLSRSMAVVAIAIIAGALPLAFYGRLYGGVENIMPARAKELLRSHGDRHVLVDVRPADTYLNRHVDGAEHWSLQDIEGSRVRDDVPQELRDRVILVICDAGISSVRAARHLQSIEGVAVQNVRGGIQEWIASAAGLSPAAYDRWRTGDGQVIEFPHRDMSRLEQWLAVLSGIGLVKPTYTVLSLILVIVLWRSTDPDLTALRWAMICFFVGENFCAVNWLVFNDTSWMSEYLHGLGMLLCFGLITYAILEGMDQHVFMLSAPGRRCAALSLCGKCTKNADVPCGFRRTFMILIPALMVVACMPLVAERVLTSYNTRILGTPYNYTHRMVYQLFEAIYCPAAAVCLLGISLAILIFGKADPLPWAKVVFAAGAGAMGFSMFRTVLAGVYAENQLWFAFWEEVTEFLFITGVIAILWIFRHGLFRHLGSEAATG